MLLETAGIVFLATPFRGSDAASAAKWCVVVGGIMGKRTSEQLVEDLDRKDKELQSLRQYFAELTHNIRLPIHHFYETKETDILRKLLPPSIANRTSSILNKKTKLLVCCYLKDADYMLTYDSLSLKTLRASMVPSGKA